MTSSGGGSIRLQKLLSSAGVASRRAAEQLILDGRVSVNGQVVRALGSKADPARDEVRVDGRRVRVVANRRYLLLNKPRGVLSTRSDPRGRPTVIDLVKAEAEYLFPVGRLDFDSEGLLLLTNDGELAERLTHPRHDVEKVYHVRVRGVPDDHGLARLRRGLVVEGRRTRPAEVEVIETGRGARGDQAVLEITLREGRNRQVREMLEAVGHPVVRLRRVRIGPLTDRTLAPGQWRDLTPRELALLRAASAGPDSGRTPHGAHARREAALRNSPSRRA
jgi:pseudouridine synthase